MNLLIDAGEIAGGSAAVLTSLGASAWAFERLDLRHALAQTFREIGQMLHAMASPLLVDRRAERKATHLAAMEADVLRDPHEWVREAEAAFDRAQAPRRGMPGGMSAADGAATLNRMIGCGWDDVAPRRGPIAHVAGRTIELPKDWCLDQVAAWRQECITAGLGAPTVEDYEYHPTAARGPLTMGPRPRPTGDIDKDLAALLNWRKGVT